MKKYRYFYIAFALGINALCGCSTKIVLDGGNIESKIAASMVKITCYDLAKENVLTQGSGFFIDNKGTFITNYHVVEGSYYVRAELSSGAKAWVKTINCYNYKNSDFAVCSLGSISTKAVTFSNSISPNQTVYAFGFPNDSMTLKQSSGQILSEKVVESKRYIVNTADIDHGSSGGALVNQSGQVVGITTGSLDSGNSLAVPYDSFKDSLHEKTVNKEPLNCFHSVVKRSLTANNLGTFFNCDVSITSTTAKMISCRVQVQLKPLYWLEAMLEGSTYLYLSYKVTADYTLKDYSKVWTVSDYVSFKIYNSNIKDIHESSALLAYTGSQTVLSKSNLQIFSFTGAGTLCLVN